MATPDLSRDATDFRKHWTDVHMQQGRVLTDDDFNESARLREEDIRRTRVDVIGTAGSPDDGFLIKQPSIPGANATFTISAGTLYLGGLRLSLEDDEDFLLQKDWLQHGADDPQLLAPDDERFDLVYIEAWQQPVSAVEDTELLEVAIGSSDTSVRVRVVRRVRVKPDIGGADCDQGWPAVLADHAAQGALNDELELVSDARLTVEPDDTAGSPDLCSPPVQGGYLGAENQAIRVQIVAPGEFTWGFDNAAPLYRVQLNGNEVTMLTVPKDLAHWPLAGQVVELIAWSAVLPNGQKIAELSGHFSKVLGSYSPNDSKFSLVTPPAAGFGIAWKGRSDQAALNNEGEFFYLRVWNRGADTTSSALIPFVAGTAVTLGHTGLKLTFTGAQFGDLFWIIAARPESPNVVVPWELSAGRAAHGVRRWLAPLGVIRWAKTVTTGAIEGTVVDDCRPTFPPLTRIRTCCTYTVGDNVSSYGHFSSIQTAINHLPLEGGQICVLPGLFTENIIIGNRKNITLSGCGVRSRVVSLIPDEDATAGPVIHVRGGLNITIDSLSIEAHETGLGLLLEGADPNFDNQQSVPDPLVGLTLAELFVIAVTQNAIRVENAHEVTIRECHVRMKDQTCLHHALFALGDDMLIERNVVEVPSAKVATIGTVLEFYPGSLSRGGIQIGGTSDRVRIIDNLIRGGAGNGITLGSLIFVDTKDQPVPTTSWPKPFPVDPCDPLQPASAILVLAPQANQGDLHPASAGTLTEIFIERNRIYQMGMNGIGVVGFFDLSEANELISVEGLSIIGNDIRGCLRRSMEEIPATMIDSVGYGGISLADVERLVIRDNQIVNNGASHIEPICGVFLLHVEGMEVSRNQILNNGAKITAKSSEPKRGRRGGINVVYAVTPMTPVLIDDFSFPGQNGEPALKVHENIVTVPLGRALTVAALGPVSVSDNQFTSRGVVRGATFHAATVAILNLGLAVEFYMNFKSFAEIGKLLLTAVQPAAPTQVDQNDKTLGFYFASGDVHFANNQCVLDVIESGPEFLDSSIVILTLDDLAFHGNQCGCYLIEFGIFIGTFLFGVSVQASNNRFKESLMLTMFSAFTRGFANITANNQATHCLLAQAQLQPQLLVSTGNLVLSDPEGKVCGGISP